MGYIKAIISAILGFFIEQQIVDAFTKGICQTGLTLGCIGLNVLGLILFFSGIYVLITLIFPNWNI